MQRPQRAGDAGPDPAVHVLAEEQAALRRVTAIAVAGEPPEAVFAAVTAEASALLGGTPVSLARYESRGTEQVILGQTGDHVAVGAWFPATDPDGISARMWRSGRAERTDDFAVMPLQGRVRQLGVMACVAVPVVVEGSLWGSLAAASRTGPLPADTEARLTLFAEIVATAVVGAAARTRLQSLAGEQAALLRVAALVARGAAETVIFDAVAVEAAALIDDEPTTLVRYEGRRTFTVCATRNGPVPVGARVTLPEDDTGTLADVLRTLRPARQDHHADIAGRSSSRREFGVGSSVSVPIIVNGRLWGSLGTLNTGRRLPVETDDRLAEFAELVASALADVEARAELERFGEEQGALRRVAELAAVGASSTRVLEAIVTEASRLSDGAVVAAVRKARSGGWRWVDTGRATSPDQDALLRRVLATGGPAHIGEAGDLLGLPRPEGGEPVWGSAVPVLVDGETWGALLATSGSRPLPSSTAERLTHFAQIAATAETGARSRRALGRRVAEQAALRRVAELVARGAALDEVFDAITAEASTVLGDAAANLVRHDGDHSTVVATHHGSRPAGRHIPAGAGTGAVVAVPVVVEGRVWGRLSTAPPGPAPPADAEDRLTEFAQLAAAAIANAENRAKLRASRARVVATADETRRRLQRDVHDGAQQRLVQTVLALRVGVDAAGRGQDPVDLIREALESAERATVDLRDVVHGILPEALSRGGLRTGLESFVAGVSVPVDLDVSALPSARLPGDLEVTAYFVVAEALTNVVKHSRATRARVTVAGNEQALVVEVADDGIGGADPRGGTGLTGLSDRVDAMDGVLVLTTTGGTGTTVRATLPVPGGRAG